MRHATVAFLRAEMRDPWDRRNIALQVRAKNAVAVFYLHTQPECATRPLR